MEEDKTMNFEKKNYGSSEIYYNCSSSNAAF